MASKIFINANVLLDFTLKRAHYAGAKQIFELAVNGQVYAFITPSIVHIAGYWLTKAYGLMEAKDISLTLLAEVHVIDITHGITLIALHSKISDIEDALQYYTAIHHSVDYFILEDKKLQKESIPVLPVYTPKEFIK
jgi:predicted nucleic acid-binding protein